MLWLVDPHVLDVNPPPVRTHVLLVSAPFVYLKAQQTRKVRCLPVFRV